MILKEGVKVNPELAIGQSLGFSVHAEETKAALKRNGVKFSDNGDAQAAFHQCPSHVFEKEDGMKNILYTAYEVMDLPTMYTLPLINVDLLVTVSNFVKKIYEPHYKKKIEVCHLGVDTKTFSYKKRKLNDDYPFVFLWVGAPNERKGWELIRKAWNYFAGNKKFILYVKTTKKDDERVYSSDNVIVDTRKLSREELAGIYHLANCFLFPSFAEGFGLPLAEAMATGLPCIYTPYGGVNDFANNDIAYPLKYEMVNVKYNGEETKGACASVSNLYKKMFEVVTNYRKAVIKGKRASENINKYFSWDCTGIKMKSILKNFLEN